MASTSPASVKVRLYAQGIGDCILIDLPRADGGRLHLLIDCGAHQMMPGSNKRMAEVVQDIHERTDGVLDVIAGTHEHWDHLSAFLTARGAWAKFTVGDVWLSWAEDPDDEVAKQLDRFKGDGAAIVSGLRSKMPLAFGVGEGLVAGVDSLMGFLFGAAGERVRSAREALRLLAPDGRPRYLLPGTDAPAKGLHDGVRIRVLGPPRDAKTLRIHDNPSNEYRFGAGAPAAGPFAAVSAALSVSEGRIPSQHDPYAPFDGDQGARLCDVLEGDWSGLDEAGRAHFWQHYFEDSAPLGSSRDLLAERRRIDGEWLGSALDFALQLDRNTNNSSLVLAIELEASGHVLLFAADAQGGNWKSWKDVEFEGGQGKIAADLVARTAFYKVGHHGSVNATAKDALESMDAANLIAFVPVDTDVALNRCRWKDFPAGKLMAALGRQTQGRLIASDSDWVKDQTLPDPMEGWKTPALVSATRGMAGSVPWVELEFR
ncbi:hypothetical protein L6Q21_16130 [Sandaracinobacter sp. RS1-74]|uniref:hypothetical protein n=1 Tax=Sandaracinobacteroides sayramensis TaxID=2913411 RepID=UPI001EDAF358|nr:hypothetical protein [Sandaracinobacteroides sayramensis]MCG2842507.1 hypothetical protein [Sandaracinobacteroides sayramensis]